eukprot:TRINITY_DN3906_c0_g2_i1.p1 TRINITY_DN3906_c0_g2~~TRINITY_DN3906_c0_g2_i1.p1  ORF type:complete len:651 (+),score=136.97 TRINITY_DN3906_c0_g2_i1:168-2120(+)
MGTTSLQLLLPLLGCLICFANSASASYADAFNLAGFQLALTVSFPGNSSWVYGRGGGGSTDDPCVANWPHVKCSDGNVDSVLLQGTGIVGEFNYFLTEMPSLQTLLLQDNNLSGPLPFALFQLVTLQSLNVSNNSMSGDLSVLSSLPLLTGADGSLDVSYNNFSGEIPAELQKQFCYDRFKGNPLLTNASSVDFPPCVRNFISSPPPPALVSKSNDTGAIVGGVVGGLALLAALALVAWLLLFRKASGEEYRVLLSEQDQEEIEAGLAESNLGQLRRYTLAELTTASNNWGTVLGSGATAKVFKGSVKKGGAGAPAGVEGEDGIMLVAIKRFDNSGINKAQVVQFCNELDVISLAVHRNVMRLHGYCVEKGERILVFPFMSNGSVEDHLRGNKANKDLPLGLAARHRIALGASRGLVYLHEECSVRIIHRDIKAGNVLLDEYFEPVVTDFGLAKVLGGEEDSTATGVKGTFGHIAPEYILSGVVSEKTDVYAFGVFLLELVTGENAAYLTSLPEDEEDVNDWLDNLLADGRLIEVVDPRLRMSFFEKDSAQDLQDMLALAQIACICINPDPNKRPSMAECMRLLQGDAINYAQDAIAQESLEENLNSEYLIQVGTGTSFNTSAKSIGQYSIAAGTDSNVSMVGMGLEGPR